MQDETGRDSSSFQSITYSKVNPVDALDEGRIDFPALIAKLKGLGYTGALTIERESGGSRQIADIKRAIKILSELI